MQDDIPHGLCVLKDIAEQLHQLTPWIDLLIVWHQNLMGKEYLVNGRLVGRDIGETSALTVLGMPSMHVMSCENLCLCMMIMLGLLMLP